MTATDRKAIAMTNAALAQSYAQDLIMAELGTLEPEKRQFHYRRSFAAWAAMCRRQPLLEELAPNSARDGYDLHAASLEAEERARQRNATTNNQREVASR